jgi:hypothetical protein
MEIPTLPRFRIRGAIRQALHRDHVSGLFHIYVMLCCRCERNRGLDLTV